jgi:hypothetical protein
MILYSALNHGSSSVRFGVGVLFIHMHLNSHCFLLLSYSNINNVRWCERWERVLLHMREMRQGGRTITKYQWPVV